MDDPGPEFKLDSGIVSNTIVYALHLHSSSRVHMDMVWAEVPSVKVVTALRGLRRVACSLVSAGMFRAGLCRLAPT